MTSMGIFIKDNDEKILDISRKFIKKLSKNNYKIIVKENQAKALGLSGAKNLDEFKNAKYIVSIGGDGTMLRASRIFCKLGMPILGINLGRRGFLTEIKISQAEKMLSQISKGEYHIDERMMIGASIIRNNKNISSIVALNDIAIGKSGIARIIRLEASADNNFLTSYAGDGLIISTPTGSTGHNLSAGGPIIDPNLSVIILTAICSLSISNRSIVVDGDKKLAIEITNVPNGIQVMLTIDGQEVINLQEKDMIVIKKSSYKTKFIRLNKYNFFSVLKDKLGWAG